MKPTTMLLTVMMLLAGTAFVGCSFNTKDKVRVDTKSVNKLIVPEISLKKEVNRCTNRTQTDE